MSRNYSMTVRIQDHFPEKETAIKEAADEEWDFDNWFDQELDGRRCLTGYGDSRLCGGETEEEFADRLASAIWIANGAYCRIEILATYLDDLPCETYCPDEDDYRRVMAAEESAADEQSPG